MTNASYILVPAPDMLHQAQSVSELPRFQRLVDFHKQLGEEPLPLCQFSLHQILKKNRRHVIAFLRLDQLQAIFLNCYDWTKSNTHIYDNNCSMTLLSNHLKHKLSARNPLYILIIFQKLIRISLLLLVQDKEK